MNIDHTARRRLGLASMAFALMLPAGCGGLSSANVEAKAEPLSAESKAAFQAQLDQANIDEKAQQIEEKATSKAKGPSTADSEERAMRRN